MTEKQHDNTSEWDREQLAIEARKAKVWEETRIKSEAEQRELENAARVHTMGRVEFEEYKRNEFRKTEARAKEAEQQAKS